MITNLEEFSLDLRKFSAQIGVDFRLVLKRTALSIFSNIIRRTPVKTGHARASWVIAANQFPEPVTIPEDKTLTPSEATQEALSRATDLDVPNPFSVIVIANYLPYINLLEHGSSKQAPEGMVSLSLQEEFSRLRAQQGAIS